MPRKPPANLEAAIADVPELGLTGAAKKHRISKTTLHRHCSERGIATVPNEQTAAAVKAAQMRWEERRIEMAHRIGDTAELALARATEALEADNPRNAKDAATTMAILVDKAQLLSGSVTARHEQHNREGVLADARDAGLRLVG